MDGEVFLQNFNLPITTIRPMIHHVYYCDKNQLPVRTQEQVLRDSGYPEDIEYIIFGD